MDLEDIVTVIPGCIIFVGQILRKCQVNGGREFRVGPFLLNQIHTFITSIAFYPKYFLKRPEEKADHIY